MDALAADPNIGMDAIYRASGTGVPVSLRLVRSAPDRLADAFSTSVIQASDVLTVAIAVLPSIEADDTFTLGADTLTVQHAERDAAGIAWRVFCRR
ncbi:hypothetical protein EXY23_09520 [Roseicella aquatilis]|uniref:Uncharacterized protein n=2 Tax=Roseicella aquatilis TaxID=2527868 RepID=A0A4R4DU53_9PROT|nr:hypothetical protein EXY23_09520 [Roseicella aquatilis]